MAVAEWIGRRMVLESRSSDVCSSFVVSRNFVVAFPGQRVDHSVHMRLQR